MLFLNKFMFYAFYGGCSDRAAISGRNVFYMLISINFLIQRAGGGAATVEPTWRTTLMHDIEAEFFNLVVTVSMLIAFYKFLAHPFPQQTSISYTRHQACIQFWVWEGIRMRASRHLCISGDLTSFFNRTDLKRKCSV